MYLHPVYSVCSPKFGRWLPQKSVILLARVSSSADSVILVGDFNLHDVCWSLLIGQSLFSNSFCDCLWTQFLPVCWLSYSCQRQHIRPCPHHFWKHHIWFIGHSTTCINLTDRDTVSFNTQPATQLEESNKHLTFLKLTLRNSATTCLKLISATVTTLSLWKTYGQQSKMPFCMLWMCTYRWWKWSHTNILNGTTQT